MATSATVRVPLSRFALARSGDKGAHANIGVWVKSEAAFHILLREVTADVVAAHFAALHPRAVERYELPNLLACNFLLLDVLGIGGASGSLRTDAQAKTYAAGLLRIEVDVPLDLLDTR